MDQSLLRALTEPGYMPLSDYIERFSFIKDDDLAEFAEAVKPLGLGEKKPETVPA